MAKRVTSRTRKFGGHIYTYQGAVKTKTLAKKRANRQRDLGNPTRAVKQADWYLLYSKKEWRKK
jgi:hypothetical protein